MPGRRRGAGSDDETAREGAAAGRRARAGACVGGGSPIGDGEGRVQSGNFKPGTWLGPEGETYRVPVPGGDTSVFGKTREKNGHPGLFQVLES